MQRWLAIYSKPRWEKKVNKLLQEQGFESYCPLNKVRRKWSDRYKVVEEPLFKSYVFVKVSENERTRVRMTPGVINFLYWNGKPAIVKDKEIRTIQLFLNEYQDIEVLPLDLKPLQKVRVTAGPLMDSEGTVLDVTKKTVKLSIESLGYMLVATVDKIAVSNI